MNALEQGFQSFRAAPRDRSLFFLGDLRHLYQRQFHQQPLVAALAVVDVAIVHDFQCLIQELRLTSLRLILELLHLPLAHLQQRKRLRVFCHHHIAHMSSQSADEMSAIESLVDYIIEEHHHLCHFVLQRKIDDVKIVLTVEHVQVLNHFFVSDIPLAERYGLVEDGQGIAHAAIGFLGNHVQRILLVGNAFLFSHHLQMIHDVGNGHALEVVDLATADDGGENLVFLGGGKDKDDMSGRFFQRFKEGIEGSR